MRILLLVLAMTLVSTTMSDAAPMTRELPRMENPALSPDGRYLAYLVRDTAGRAALELINLDLDDARTRVLDSGAVEGGASLDFCGWGSNERLLCGFHRADGGNGEVSGLVVLNPDGSGLKTLLRQVRAGGDERTRPEVIDWQRDDLESVLVAVYASGENHPAVQRLDLETGALETKVAAQAPIRHFILDEYGEVRFGWGEEAEGRVAAFARLGKARLWRSLRWQRLSRYPGTIGLRPLPGDRVVEDRVWALGPFQKEGDDGMWQVDLTDRTDPQPPKYGYGTRAQPLSTPSGKLMALTFPGSDRAPTIFHARSENALERIGPQLPGKVNVVIDYVDNPSRFIVKSQPAEGPARLYLYGIAGGDFLLRELGRVERVARLQEAPRLAVARAEAAAPSDAEDLDILITVTDPATKAPIRGLPMRVVLSSDADWRAPDAGKRYVTDDQGRVRDTLKVRMQGRRVNLDIPLITHQALGFEIGLEIRMDGMPLLYTLTLDEVKKARGTLISDTQVYTRAEDGTFTREVELTWNAYASQTEDVYLFPPREPKTFERLPNPPPFRLTQRNLQLLPHAKADGTNRWALDLRLTLDPYRPREGG